MKIIERVSILHLMPPNRVQKGTLQQEFLFMLYLPRSTIISCTRLGQLTYPVAHLVSIRWCITITSTNDLSVHKISEKRKRYVYYCYQGCQDLGICFFIIAESGNPG
jgi:hypothetical protein